ncbi:uncharacterized protein LOC124170072 [Ischnura elegans]|uniref:uncharacterized protein LOC124170072 n=1 Tax=Ischnura elegans TaxID=197161 RepID=UPI001ED8B578|nr:uncharacterized protein LOC124170072 [Ischnura elegans]
MGSEYHYHPVSRLCEHESLRLHLHFFIVFRNWLSVSRWLMTWFPQLLARTTKPQEWCRQWRRGQQREGAERIEWKSWRGSQLLAHGWERPMAAEGMERTKGASPQLSADTSPMGRSGLREISGGRTGGRVRATRMRTTTTTTTTTSRCPLGNVPASWPGSGKRADTSAVRPIEGVMVMCRLRRRGRVEMPRTAGTYF